MPTSNFVINWVCWPHHLSIKTVSQQEYFCDKKDIFPNLWLFVLFAELGSNRAMGRVPADWVLQSVQMVNIGIVNLLGQNLYFVL